MIELALLGGSLFSGWISFFPWLAAPPVIIFLWLWNARRNMRKQLKERLGQEDFGSQLIRDQQRRSEITTFVGITILNTVVFFAAWGVSLLF